MKHSHILNIPIVDAYKVDPIAHCRTLKPFVDINGYRLFIINNETVFNEEWLERFPVPMQETSFVFVREPRSQALMPAVHMDYFPPDRGYIYAINYTLDGCDTSRMVWYENANGTPATTRYPAGSVVEIERVPLPSDRPLLMDTTTYHGIKVGTKDRWVMSLRPIDCVSDGTDGRNWNNIVESYRELIL